MSQGSLNNQFISTNQKNIQKHLNELQLQYQLLFKPDSQKNCKTSLKQNHKAFNNQSRQSKKEGRKSQGPGKYTGVNVVSRRSSICNNGNKVSKNIDVKQKKIRVSGFQNQQSDQCRKNQNQRTQFSSISQIYNTQPSLSKKSSSGSKKLYSTPYQGQYLQKPVNQEKQLKLKVQPHGFTKTIYNQIFPLGSKSYGVIYENYYCLMIQDQESIHINRCALPESLLIFANIEIFEDIIYLQSICLANNLIPKLDKTKQNIKSDSDREQSTQRIFIHEDQGQVLNIKNTSKRQEKNRLLNSRFKDVIDEKEQYQMNELTNKKLQAKKAYLHINLIQYSLKSRKVTSNNNFCLQYKSTMSKLNKNASQKQVIAKFDQRNSRKRIINKANSNQKFYNSENKANIYRNSVVRNSKKQKSEYQDLNFLLNKQKQQILNTIKKISLLTIKNKSNEQKQQIISKSNQNQPQSSESLSKQEYTTFNQNNNNYMKCQGSFNQQLQENKRKQNSLFGKKYQNQLSLNVTKSFEVKKQKHLLNSESSNISILIQNQIKQRKTMIKFQEKLILSSQKISSQKQIFKRQIINTGNKTENSQKYQNDSHNLQRAQQQCQSCHIESFTIVIQENNQNLHNQSSKLPQESSCNVNNIISIFNVNLKQHLEDRFQKQRLEIINFQKDKNKNSKHEYDLGKNITYQILEYQIYSQYLHENQRTVNKNWLKMEKNKVFLTTNLSVYEIKRKKQLKNDTNQSKQQDFLFKIKQIEDQSKQKDIKCKNLKILQKIFEYQGNKISNNHNNFSNKSRISLNQNEIWNQNPIKDNNKHQMKQKKIASQIINCSWLSQTNYFVLTSNNIIYQIDCSRVVNSQDLLSLVRNYKYQKQQLIGHYNKQELNNERLRVQQIQCVGNQNNSQNTIITRIRQIIESTQNSNNYNLAEKNQTIYSDYKYLNQKSQPYLYVFKYHKRWTQFYTKIQNVINKKTMYKWISQNIGNQKSFSYTSCNEFHIDFNSIKLKTLNFSTSLPSYYLAQKQSQMDQNVSKKNQFFIYCQWGIRINNQKNSRKTNTQKLNTNLKHEEQEINKIGKNNFDNFKKYHNQSMLHINNKKLQINKKLQQNDQQCKNNSQNLELFIVELNILTKNSKDNQQFNPICYRLQDYYHSNIKNIYQIKYRNMNMQKINKKINHSSNLSYSANIFNFAILSPQSQNLTIYKKNTTLNIKTHHFLQVGLNSQIYLQKFTYNFEFQKIPICICIDNFALNLVCAMSDQIILYYILKDKLVKGLSLYIRQIKFLKYDAYNWHLYAHNQDTLYIIDPWKFEVERELYFDGKIKELKIDNNFVIVKWIQENSESTLLTVFSIYEAVSQDFKTYEKQLNLCIPRKALNQIMILKPERQDNGYFIDGSEQKDKLQKIQLKYCYQTDADTNCLIIVNQFFIEIYDMQFTSTEFNNNNYNKGLCKQIQIYSTQYTQSQQPSLILADILKNVGAKDMNKINKYLSSNTPITSNLELKPINLQIGNQKMNKYPKKTSIFTNYDNQIKSNIKLDNIKQDQASSFIFPSDNKQQFSKYIDITMRNLLNQYGKQNIQNSEIGIQTEYFENNLINRIKISYHKPKPCQFTTDRLITGNFKQWPTCIKYQKSLQILIIGTNLGKILMFYFNPKKFSNQNIQFAIPFYCEYVSTTTIQAIMISKNVLSVYVNIFTTSQSVITLLLSSHSSYKNFDIVASQSNSVEIENQNENNSHKFLKDIFDLSKQQHPCLLQTIATQKKMDNLNEKSIEKPLLGQQKETVIKNQINLQFITACIGENQINSLFSSNYAFCTAQSMKQLKQQIQYLQLCLLKIKGDKEQLLIKKKKFYEQQISKYERQVYNQKINEKFQQNRLFIVGKNSLNNLHKFYQDEHEHSQNYLVKKLKDQYLSDMRSLYKEQDKLKNQYQRIKSQNQLQSKNMMSRFTNQIKQIQYQYKHKLTAIQDKISELENQNQRNKKIQSICIQQTHSQCQQLKEKEQQIFNEILDNQKLLESKNKYGKWNIKNNIIQRKNKINQLQQLSKQFQMELRCWKNAMHQKQNFYKKCNIDYISLQKTVQQKQKNWIIIDNQINSGKTNNVVLSKHICNLHAIIKYLTQKIKIKQQQELLLLKEQKKINHDIMSKQGERLNIQNQITITNSQIQQKINYIQFLKNKNNRLKLRNIAEKSRVKKMIQHIFMLMDQCLNDFYQNITQNKQHTFGTTDNETHSCFRNFSLKQLKPPKYNKKHSLYINRHIPNLKIVMDTNNIPQFEYEPNSAYKQEQFIEFMKMLKLIKQRKVYFQIGDDYKKKMNAFLKSYEYEQSYVQNRDLIAQVNRLRQITHELQKDLQKIKNQYNKVKDQRKNNMKNKIISNQGQITCRIKNKQLNLSINKSIKTQYKSLQKNKTKSEQKAVKNQNHSPFQLQNLKKRFRIFSLKQDKLINCQKLKINHNLLKKTGKSLSSYKKQIIIGQSNKRALDKFYKDIKVEDIQVKNAQKQKIDKKRTLSIEKILRSLSKKYEEIKNQDENQQVLRNQRSAQKILHVQQQLKKSNVKLSHKFPNNKLKL